MKCLVFLVLVAVCQAVVLRDQRRIQEQRKRPRIEDKQVDQLRRVFSEAVPTIQQSRESSVKQSFGQGQFKDNSRMQIHDQLKHYPLKFKLMKDSTMKTPTEVKVFEKLPPQQLKQLNIPNYPYTKPQTFLDYIETFSNNEPWDQITSVYPDVLDFKTFWDLIQFPGGDFLQQEIDKCLWNMPEDERVPVYPMNKFMTRVPFDTSMQIDLRKVEGVRDVLPYIVTKLEKMVPLYMQTINDPSTMAMLVTRDLITIVLHGRMKCPTTTWDKYFIENINNQLFNAINEEKYQLLNFRTMLPEVIPEVTDMIEQLVYTITQDIQEHVRKDVMQYAHGVAFKDVAIVCHKLYHELKRVFEESWQQDVPTLMQQLVTVVTDVITNYGTCPREQFFYNKNKLACWDFNKMFLEREVVQLHSRVMNIVQQFMYRACTGQECMQYYPRMTELFKTIIKQYIATVIDRVPMCQTPDCLDQTECMLNRYPFLEPSRVERFNGKIPLWNTLDKFEQFQNRRI